MKLEVSVAEAIQVIKEIQQQPGEDSGNDEMTWVSLP